MTENEVKSGGEQNWPQQPPQHQEHIPPPKQKKLFRSTSSRWIAGVCGGLGEHFDIDPTIIRVLWVILTIFTVGIAGVIGYLLLWALVEEYPGRYRMQGPYVTRDERGGLHYHYYYRSTR